MNKRPLNRIIRPAFPACLVSAFLMILFPFSAAQQRVAAPQSGQERMTTISAGGAKLASVLKMLSAGNGICIVADDHSQSKRSIPEFRGTLKEGLDRVGSAYGQSWTGMKSGIIVMQKRFEDPEQVPQLLAGEMRQTAKDELAILPVVAPDPDHEAWGQMLIRLSQTLDAAQTQALSKGRRFSRADLSPAQWEIVQQAILSRSYGVPRWCWERIYQQLKDFDRSEIRLVPLNPQALPGDPESRPYNVFHVFQGLNGRIVEKQIGQFIREGGPKQRSTAEAAGAVVALPVSPGPATAQVSAAPHDAAPLVPDTVKLAKVVHIDLGETTAGAVVSELSRQTGLTVQTPDYLAERKLTIFADGCRARDLLDAIDELEDWKWERMDSGNYLLGRPVFRRPTALSKLPALMASALPKDLRGYLHLADRQEDTNRDPRPPLSFRLMAAKGGAQNRFMQSLRDAPKLRDRIPCSDLTPSQRTDLMLFCFSDMARHAADLMQDEFSIHSLNPAEATVRLEKESVLVIGWFNGDDHLASFGKNVTNR